MARRVSVAGLTTALVATAAFGLAHAVIIVPIWTRLLGHAPFVLLAGLGLAWAFDALAQCRRSQTVAPGVQFGAIMFLTLVPSTAVDTALRLAGYRSGAWLSLSIAPICVASGAVLASAHAYFSRQDVS